MATAYGLPHCGNGSLASASAASQASCLRRDTRLRSSAREAAGGGTWRRYAVERYAVEAHDRRHGMGSVARQDALTCCLPGDRDVAQPLSETGCG
jgi:hypothetical protein